MNKHICNGTSNISTLSKINPKSLIDDYRKQTKICSKNDCLKKSSIKKNNKAVDRMYQIVDLISKNNCQNEIDKFSKLLYDKKNRTNLWSAIHLLEKLTFDKQTEKTALKIIQNVAKGDSIEALGFQYWLKEYKSK
ncbi:MULTISPECIES: hypothetical protein [Aquimarina]|uniref:hypothetical protein n=1 Tax=Aquimarina TaxID=290174 RepID=UPI0009432460|nr:MULTISPECIES: hypothetical protein [Aquimarina]